MLDFQTRLLHFYCIGIMLPLYYCVYSAISNFSISKFLYIDFFFSPRNHLALDLCGNLFRYVKFPLVEHRLLRFTNSNICMTLDKVSNVKSIKYKINNIIYTHYIITLMFDYSSARNR